MRPPAFHELWQLAAELAPTTASGRAYGPVSTFDCAAVGLLLYENEHREGYDATPLNADTFASTGGDGVHFSFLHVPGVDHADSPVVMTVPMSGGPWNYVVGNDLLDFLSLGCVTGYFWLEQLAYSPAEVIATLESGECRDPDDEDSRLLAAIRERFGLSPWTGVRDKLHALHGRYTSSIELSPEARESHDPDRTDPGN